MELRFFSKNKIKQCNFCTKVSEMNLARNLLTIIKFLFIFSLLSTNNILTTVSLSHISQSNHLNPTHIHIHQPYAEQLIWDTDNISGKEWNSWVSYCQSDPSAIPQYSQFQLFKIQLPTYFLQANVRRVPQLDDKSFLPDPSNSFHTSHPIIWCCINSKLSGIQNSHPTGKNSEEKLPFS
jgi:hypothetical protein